MASSRRSAGEESGGARGIRKLDLLSGFLQVRRGLARHVTELIGVSGSFLLRLVPLRTARSRRLGAP
jgi:hypothetical protein